jgi:hypothetical protein
MGDGSGDGSDDGSDDGKRGEGREGEKICRSPILISVSDFMISLRVQSMSCQLSQIPLPSNQLLLHLYCHCSELPLYLFKMLSSNS